MRPIFRFLAVLLSGVLMAACSPSADKPASASQPAPASAKPASPVAEAPAPVAPAQQGSGEYFSTLASGQPVEATDRVEVVEFFGYFCNHCHALDPVLSAWVKKQGNRIAFKRIPVRADEAKLYYALETMGKLDALHEKLFHAVQVERKRLNNENAAAEFVAQQGVDAKQFREHYNSFSVQSKAMNAAKVSSGHRIEGVPAIAVDGRFVTSAAQAGQRPGTEQTESGYHAAVLQVLDELVAKVRKERQLK